MVCKISNISLWTLRSYALDALHTSTEAYVSGMSEDANSLAVHPQHIAVQPIHIQLACRIQEEKSCDCK